MTREEALQWLKEMKDTIELYNALSNSYTFDKFPQAIDMAISALQEESRPIKVRNDGTLFIKVLDVSKVERVIIGDDTTALRHDFPKPFSNYITESPNEVDEKNDEVIKSVRCKNCEWFKNCEYFEKPPCTKQTEPSDLISRAEALMELNGACSNWQDDAKVAEIIHNLPSCHNCIECESVSAERVVRCKDCEYRYEEGDCTHYYWCRINDRPIDDDNFCSWAKMKGGAE